MANKNVTVSITMQYPGPDAETVAPPKKTITCPFQAESVGTIDIPDATNSGTSFDVPFGAIGDECTCALIENRTAQPLQVKINGAAAVSHRIAAGGAMLISNAAEAGGNEITEIALITTAAQVGDESVAYRLFGDPT